MLSHYILTWHVKGHQAKSFTVLLLPRKVKHAAQSFIIDGSLGNNQKAVATALNNFVIRIGESLVIAFRGCEDIQFNCTVPMKTSYSILPMAPSKR